MTERTTPPFRADHVGSLLRTAPLKEARAKREKDEISATALKEVEDREIAEIISRQEDIGLQAVTDGEFRRAFWNYDFLGGLPGVEAYLGERKIKFQGVNPKPMMLRVTGKLGTFSGHPMLDHFKYRERAHARDAEDDNPVAVIAAFSIWPRRGAGIDLSGHERVLPRSRPNIPQSRARFCRCRLPLSAARRGQFRLSLRSEAACTGRQPRRRSGHNCPRYMPG